LRTAGPRSCFQSTVASISAINTIIAKINDYQTTIASAVEEQTATTGEMSRSVSDAAGEVDETATNIGSVAQLTTESVAESSAARCTGPHRRPSRSGCSNNTRTNCRRGCTSADHVRQAQKGTSGTGAPPASRETVMLADVSEVSDMTTALVVFGVVVGLYGLATLIALAAERRPRPQEAVAINRRLGGLECHAARRLMDGSLDRSAYHADMASIAAQDAAEHPLNVPKLNR
jgi:hypothetical protein